jgi:hypothetical protein
MSPWNKSDDGRPPPSFPKKARFEGKSKKPVERKDNNHKPRNPKGKHGNGNNNNHHSGGGSYNHSHNKSKNNGGGKQPPHHNKKKGKAPHRRNDAKSEEQPPAANDTNTQHIKANRTQSSTPCPKSIQHTQAHYTRPMTSALLHSASS